MASFIRRLTKRVFLVVNFSIALLFLLSSANAFLPPKQFWIFALLGLIFPLLLMLMIGFLIFWSILRSKWAFLSLLILLISWPAIHAFYAWHFAKGFTFKKEPGAFRIITWNVHYLDQMYRPNQQQLSQRTAIINFLKQQDADIICLQEFFESDKPQYTPNIEVMKKEFKMPYYYFVDDYSHAKGLYYVGPIIFSKYLLTNLKRMRYEHASIKAVESMISADVNYSNSVFRIYTTHLQSVLFRKKEYRDIEIIKNVEDSVLEASRSLVRKLRLAYSFRGIQADSVRKELDTCSKPLIICGDFNDVPTSYTYFRIKGDRQDAFIKSGFGIGRTYSSISPTLRIDYILASDGLEVIQCKKVELPFSDHYPLIADFKLNDKK